MILYFQFKSVITTLIVFSGVVVAWAGGFLMLWLYGKRGEINEAAKRTPELGWRPPFVAEKRNADRSPFPATLRLEAQSIVQSASTGTRHPCISS